MGRRLARVAIVVCLGIATLSYGALEKRVTVRIEGRPVAVRTFAATVGEALDRAGIDVGPDDRIEPAPHAPLPDGGTIEVRRAKQVTILLDGKPRRVLVTGLTIEEVLEEIRLRDSVVDLVHPSRDARVTPGMTIEYRPAVAVTVVHDGERERVITNAPTVARLLEELEIDVGKRDEVKPSSGKIPRDGMKIRVYRVGVRRQVRSVEVPFHTVLRRTENLEYGERRLVQEGRMGLRRLRYRVRYVDGDPVSRRLLSSKLVREPVSRVIAIGSGYPGCVCNDGTQTGKATWYGEADGLTAAHRTLPLGTVVRVENLENGKWINVTIRDRGPFGDGRIIDLSDEAFRRIASLGEGVISVRIRW